MKVFFNSVCPYCQHENKLAANIEDQFTRPFIVYHCDEEEGGCGRPFVVKLKLTIDSKVAAIEGERD